MRRACRTGMMLVVVAAVTACPISLVLANGGPFVIKYPSGDPAAKGVLARLDPTLKPARETRLRVIEENLSITFGSDQIRRGEDGEQPPLAFVSAAYTIENPTGEEIEVDFGFPILRGLYVAPLSMVPRPDVVVKMGEQHVSSQVISNSAIYGIIRQRAREVIDEGIAADAALAGLVAAVGKAEGQDRVAARASLAAYLTGPLKWNERDAALMVEYASLDFGQAKGHPRDRGWAWWARDKELREIVNKNLGPLAAIGEQKATQFFAQLASRFDPKTAAAYEAIFTSWGGDVRERSLDLQTGTVRPRELTVDTDDPRALAAAGMGDPTVYARVDYLDENAQITEAEKASCKTILRNLPVIFTFAPMNLIHYTAKFPANETKQLTVSYSQYAYTDTREPKSYQLAYVVHPASLWDEFGPINLEVAVLDGVPFRASVPCERAGTEERELHRSASYRNPEKKARFDIYRATLRKKKQKKGELFLAVDAGGWKAASSGVELTAQVYENKDFVAQKQTPMTPIAGLALVAGVGLAGTSLVLRTRRSRH